jgi:hypothetical protein
LFEEPREAWVSKLVRVSDNANAIDSTIELNSGQFNESADVALNLQNPVAATNHFRAKNNRKWKRRLNRKRRATNILIG